MSKHKQQHKSSPTNRIATSISVGPEIPNQNQEQIESPELKSISQYIPSYEDVQRRAYQIHVEKGGSDLENWLEAEQVLKKEHQGG